MLTVKQLRKQAKAKGLKGYSRLRKAQLITLLSNKLVPEMLQRYITEEQWKGNTLNLCKNSIGDSRAEYLAKWPGHTLDLSWNNIGIEGVKYLAKWGGTTLNLDFNCISEEGAKALAEWKGHTLILSKNNIGDEGVKHLAKWGGTTLNLDFNYISEEGAKALVQWPGTILYLNYNQIGPEGTKVLTENWKGISLYLNGVENAEVKKRYEESVKLLLNEYFCKDVTNYVICKFLDIN